MKNIETKGDKLSLLSIHEMHKAYVASLRRSIVKYIREEIFQKYSNVHDIYWCQIIDSDNNKKIVCQSLNLVGDYYVIYHTDFCETLSKIDIELMFLAFGPGKFAIKREDTEYIVHEGF